MIVPPFNTPAFYSVLFEKPVANDLVNLISPNSQDIEKAIVTSLDMTDVEATNELSTALQTMLKDYEQVLQFNPIYLPISSKELSSKLELDSDGDIAAIDGFTNPYITARISLSLAQNANVVEGTINYKEFALPKLHEMLEKQVLVS